MSAIIFSSVFVAVSLDFFMCEILGFAVLVKLANVYCVLA
jgi:hypothetical protein